MKMASKIFDKFFGKVKLLFVTQTCFSFGVFLIIGFAIPILLAQSFQSGSAEPVIDLDRFDPAVHPVMAYPILFP